MDGISWQKLISGMYYRLTSTSEIEVEEIILNNPGIGKEKARDIIIQKQLDLDAFRKFATSSLTVGSPFLTVPEDFDFERGVQVVDEREGAH